MVFQRQSCSLKEIIWKKTSSVINKLYLLTSNETQKKVESYSFDEENFQNLKDPYY